MCENHVFVGMRTLTTTPKPALPFHACLHSCEVCDRQLTYPEYLFCENLDYQVCRSFDCRQVMGKKSSFSSALFEPHLKFSRHLILLRRQRDEVRKNNIDKVRLREAGEHRNVLQSILSANAELSEDNIEVVTIPTGNSINQQTHADRIGIYKSHLASIISEAARYSEASELPFDQDRDAYGKRLIVDQKLDAKSGLRDFSDHICSLCKGGCCKSGKEHAYLSAFSMRRFMDRHPAFSASEITDLYCSRISSRSVADSCINHTAAGCALPRELRSDICNGFYCDSLKAYQNKAAGPYAPDMAVVIQRASTSWSRFESDGPNHITGVTLVHFRDSH